MAIVFFVGYALSLTYTTLSGNCKNIVLDKFKKI